MDCQKCKLNQKRYAEESAMAFAERTIRRLWVTTIVLIVALVGVCVGFFVYESQFEDYTETSTVDTEIEAMQFGTRNFVAGGDIDYGADSPSAEDADSH